MVLTRPVTRTKISTATFGHPVYDWITANTPTAWANLTLQNGWTIESGQPLQYRKIGDLIYLRGRVNHSAGSAFQPIATLPVGSRSPVLVQIACGVVISGSWTAAAVQIGIDGTLQPMNHGYVAISFSHFFALSP